MISSNLPGQRSSETEWSDLEPPLPRPSNARPPELPLPAPSQGANETHPPAQSEANGHGRNPNPSPLKPVPEGAEPAPGPEPSLEIPARRRRGGDSRQSHRPLEMSRPNARPLERKRGQCRTGRSPPLLRPALDSQAQRRLLCNDPSGCDYPQTRSFHHHAEPDSREVNPQSAGKAEARSPQHYPPAISPTPLHST